MIIGYFMLSTVSALSDLVAEINYYPKNASVGDIVTVVAIAKNIGDVNATNVGVRVINPIIIVPYLFTNISANSEKNWVLFNWTLRYGKEILFLQVDFNNQINETDETNNDATLILGFPVTVKTDKEKYVLSEPINISIVGNYGSGHIYAHYIGFPFKIFRFENGIWNELLYDNTYVYDSAFPPYCENGTVKQIGCCVTPAWPRCKSVSINYSSVWNQWHRLHATLTCGNGTYNRWVHVPAKYGLYKIEVCYKDNEDFDFLFCSGNCIESNNFTIADSILTTNPKSAIILPNTNFTIQINISGNNIYGTQFDLYFNSTILEAIDVTEENFLKQNCTTYSTSQINNTQGKITFADTCTGDTGVNGSGVLCNITFTSKSEGPSSLNFDNVKILDSELQELYVAFTDGMVHVDSALPADVNNDYTVDIFDLSTVGKAFGSFCGESKYDADADINKDCEIDIYDLAFVGKNFGKSW